MLIIASQPPENFPIKQFDFHILKDSSLNTVTNSLVEKHIISSSFIFKTSVVLFGGQRGLFAGDYRLTKPLNTIAIAFRMVRGHQGQPKIRIIIPEGTNVYDMAYIYMTKLSDFNAPRFVSLAKRYEGYLFPDTYDFFANAKPEEIISTMKKNFYQKIKTIDNDIKASKRSLKDIIIMASIIEKETNADESRKIVAGILWKRIDKEMLLQVDAPFYYITAKAGNFSLDDLKIDSPYNTYKYKGLPPWPITNTGLDAILDAIHPIETSYYFYLTGKDGEIRYASTFATHIDNKNKYLK